jgi:lipopolysaccharide export LptBFGC system permease protein LptF
MAALALVTAGIAPLIAGAISFGTPARKRQAGYLMMIGVVIFGLSLISFVSQSQSGP